MIVCRLLSLIIILLICAMSGPAFAQTDAPVAALPQLQPESWGTALWRDLASPLTTPARPVFLTGTALTLGLTALREPLVEPFQREMIERQPLGSSSKLGSSFGLWIPNAVYAAGMMGHGLLTGDSASKRRSLVMFKTFVYSCGVTSLLKHTIREPRPLDGNDLTAFPSAHATAAFAFASVIQAEHGWKWGAPAYAMATFVALSRLNDNRHWLHDVVGGATIGISYGLAMHHRSLNTPNVLEVQKQPDQPHFQWQVLPTPDLRGGYVKFSGEF